MSEIGTVHGKAVEFGGGVLLHARCECAETAVAWADAAGLVALICHKLVLA